MIFFSKEICFYVVVYHITIVYYTKKSLYTRGSLTNITTLQHERTLNYRRKHSSELLNISYEISWSCDACVTTNKQILLPPLCRSHFFRVKN